MVGIPTRRQQVTQCLRLVSGSFEVCKNSVMEGNHKLLLRHVAEAQRLDDKGNFKDAYIKYLQSTQCITQHLLTQTFAGAGNAGDRRLISIAVMCAQRAEELLNSKIDAEPVVTTSSQMSICPVSTSSIVGTSVSFMTASLQVQSSVSREISTVSVQSPESWGLSSFPVQSPVPGESSCFLVQSPGSGGSSSIPAQSRMYAGLSSLGLRSNPLEIAEQQNRQLVSAFRARMSGVNRLKATNMSLGLQRRLAENLAIAKAREQALEKKQTERRIRLEAEALKRFADSGVTEEELEKRQMYTSILEFEQENKWLLCWRDKLEAHPGDYVVIQQLVDLILRTSKHPLTQLLFSYQHKVYDAVSTLLRRWQYARQVSEECKSGSNAGNEATVIMNSTQIKNIIPAGTTKSNKTGTYDASDFDDLFDGVAEVDDNTSSGDRKTRAMYGNTVGWASLPGSGHSTTDTSAPTDHSLTHASKPGIPDTGVIHLDVTDDLSGLSLSEPERESIMHHLSGIRQDIQDYMEKMVTVCSVVYTDLANATGRDSCYSCIEDAFYRPIWTHVLDLFRIVYDEEESQLTAVMSQHRFSDPSDLKVSRKFCLLPEDSLLMPEGYQPYHAAISELSALTQLTSPLAKLECIVVVSRTICKCVEEFYSNNKSDIPNIGADDLLPLLSYVVVKTQLPQMMSECYALEELVHEGYLMGEEGYCLTSLETALKYIISTEEKHRCTP